MSRILNLQKLSASSPTIEDDSSTYSAGLCSSLSAGLCSTVSGGLCNAA